MAIHETYATFLTVRTGGFMARNKIIVIKFTRQKQLKSLDVMAGGYTLSPPVTANL